MRFNSYYVPIFYRVERIFIKMIIIVVKINLPGKECIL